MWDTSPPRQVTAADAVRGLERTCNPAQPFGGLPDFETLILGMQAFCDAFAKVSPTVPAIKTFISTHSISGATVDPTNPLTVVYTPDPPGHLLPQPAGHAGLLARPGRVPQLSPGQ